MDRDSDRNMPNPAANKAEGDRWKSDSDTVERRDRESRVADENPDQTGGITNRPLKEEEENQEALPDRGESRPGAHAGHGDEDR